MANPQIENGYTPIANEIMEAVAQLQINATQFRILMVVWRYTYGFSRKQHKLSETFIANATGINKKQVGRELASLIKRNIIIEVSPPSFSSSRVIAFNKHYNSWQVTKTLTGNETVDQTGSENVDSPGSENVDQDKQSFKTNIKTKRECRSAPIPYQKIVDNFNSICVSMPKVQALSETRKKTLRSRWKRYPDIETFNTVFIRAEESDFLSGRNGKWSGCSFDWLINESNMVKVLEGNYSRDNKQTHPIQQPRAPDPKGLTAEEKQRIQEADKLIAQLSEGMVMPDE